VSASAVRTTRRVGVLEQPDRRLVPHHGLRRRRLGGVGLEDASTDLSVFGFSCGRTREVLVRRGGWPSNLQHQQV
jgi:hypothetical protein